MLTRPVTLELTELELTSLSLALGSKLSQYKETRSTEDYEAALTNGSHIGRLNDLCRVVYCAIHGIHHAKVKVVK